MDKFYDQIKGYTAVADFGGGVNGSWDYAKLFPDACIDIYDLNKDTQPLRAANITYRRADVTKLYKNSDLKEKYDLIFCEHVYEHVESPEMLSYSINKALKLNGYLHVSLPDATNFIDIFYRLLFPKSGGHIQKFTRDSLIELLTRFEFQLVDFYPMAESWGWYERSYELIRELLGKNDMSNEEFQYIADTFKKELTIDKGYFYGWCFLFKKTAPVDDYKAEGEDDIITLVEVIPTKVEEKTGCNVQPNGMSAIAVKCLNANATTLVLWDDLELDTLFSKEDYLTASIPMDYIKKGQHSITLLDYSCNVSSNSLTINVV